MIGPHLRSGRTFAHRRIGLLGGSFNPAHAGHRAMSLYALKRLGLDEIWWLVSPQNPLKPVQGMDTFTHRLGTARAFARHPKIAVTDIESQLGAHYTVDTLRMLKHRFPLTHFVWLMGADNLQQIPQWKNWTRIFTEIPIAVFRRAGYVAGRGCGTAATRFAGAWNAVHKSKKLALAPPPSWLVLDNPLNLLSATALRRHRSRRSGASESG